MLVEVVELRREGKRLTPERIKAARPTRGLLLMHDTRPGTNYRPVARRYRPRLVGLMEPTTRRFILPPLDFAWVEKIDERGMVIKGLQILGRSPKDERLVPQAWWVRVVSQPARSDPPQTGPDSAR
jgi:hypothetical protein